MSHQLTEITPISASDLKKLDGLFEPLNDVVIVAIDTAEKVTAGGIIIPKSTAENLQAQSGTVVAHGPGARSPLTGERVKLSVVVGDRVIFGEYAGHDIEYGDVKLKAMREPDCMTRVSSDDALQPESVRLARKTKARKTKARKTKARKTKETASK